MRTLGATLAILLAVSASAGTAPSSLNDAELGVAVSAAATVTRETIGKAKVESLFALAVKHGGYEAFCRENDCRPSAVVLVEPSEHVRKDHNGWYNNGNSYIKDRPNQLSLEITTVHEFTHHLQRLSNRYQQYRGVCNQYLAEKEAYLAGEAYAGSKGFTTNFERRLAPYEKRCRDAVSAGLVKLPPGMTLDSR